MNVPRLLLVAALAASALSLSGCAALLIAGVAGTALVATDRRLASAQFDDTTIEHKLGTWADERFGERAHASVTSFNGVVLLTGEVPDAAGRTEFVAKARATDRVRMVHDELVVGPPAELSARTRDAYLTSLVKSRFLEAADRFSTTQVKVVTERGVVYLMGLVQRDEADAASAIAASTSGVARVVRVFEYLG